MLDHLLDELSEELSVQTRAEGTCHLKPLLAVVISVIFRGSAKGSNEKTIDHVADEIGLLDGAIG